PTEAPPQPSPASGPIGLRARVGLRPKRPQQEAGILIEPPPSVACAMGTTPAATAAAEPPLEPPELCFKLHGLRVARTGEARWTRPGPSPACWSCRRSPARRGAGAR